MHYGIFNLDFLSKWEWRILNEENSILTNLLSCKYGDIKRMMLNDSYPLLVNEVSLWWKDICEVGTTLEANKENWFTSSIMCKLGNGDIIDFWHDRWLGSVTFYRLFEPLFQHTATNSRKLSNNGFWMDEG